MPPVHEPPQLTKRQLYSRFCFERGWAVKADGKGKLPKIKNYPVREVSDEWPEGSVPKKVPSRRFFQDFWKDNYPKVMLRPRSSDTCAQCWKYSNELRSLSRQARVAMHNEEQGENVEDMEVDEEANASSDVDEEFEELDAEQNNEEAEIRNQLNSNNSSLQNYSRRDHTVETTPTKDTGFVETHNKNMSTATRCIPCPDENAQGRFDYQQTSGLIEQMNLMRSKLLTEAAIHVNQKDEMRGLCNQLVVIAKQHEEQNVTWTERVITEVCDYSQNLGVPHFGSEQPGDTYYFSPLGVYIFGIVRLYHKTQDLVAQYYYEGVGKKGGNNVASLLWNKFKMERYQEKCEQNEGPLLEYNIVMDNCGGQNKNRMVVRFLMMLTEIGFFKTCRMVFLVRGHTKNPCDRTFALLKKNFHYKNIYTKKQVYDNLNSNEHVEAVHVDSSVFYDFDGRLNPYYKALTAGSVNRSHIFKFQHNKPGVLELQDNTSAPIRSQDMKKGSWNIEERKRLLREVLTSLNPITPPGVKAIKQLELWKKWRPLVPEEYQDDICHKPLEDTDNDQQEEIECAEDCNIETNVIETATLDNTETETPALDQRSMITEVNGATTATNMRSLPSQNENAVSEGGTTMNRSTRRCGICRQFGHNRKTCPLANSASAPTS